jgi:hypothetical protein
VNVLADMSDLMKNFSSIMNGKEMPDNIKEMLNSFANKSNNSSSNMADGSSDNTTKNIASNVSNNANNKEQSNNSHFDTQESYHRNSNNSSDNCAENSSPFDGIDFDTMMKMQKIISSMNSSSNSSGANLLRSLKPYLKPSRQAKVDECIQLLSLEKAFSLMNNSNLSNRW